MATSYDILDLVGNTPMVRLKNLTKDIDAEVYVKLEYLNPSGSIKDRVAMRMIRDAERAGLLKEGMELIESTTGNMGTALDLCRRGMWLPGNTVCTRRPGKRGAHAYSQSIRRQD